MIILPIRDRTLLCLRVNIRLMLCILILYVDKSLENTVSAGREHLKNKNLQLFVGGRLAVEGCLV